MYLPVTAILGTVRFHNFHRLFWFHTIYLLVFQSFSEREKKSKSLYWLKINLSFDRPS